MFHRLAIALLVSMIVTPLATAQTPAAGSDQEFTEAIYAGKRYFGIPDYAAAYEKFAAADAIRPNQAAILYNMALLLTKLNKYSDAQKQIDRYLQLYPQGPQASQLNVLQGEVTFQRDLQRRKQQFHDYETLFNKGRYSYSSGNREAALAIFLAAEQQRPEDPAAVYNQSIIHEQLGDLIKARAALRRYSELIQDAGEATTVDQKIFALDTEIDDMRTKIVCSFCGHRLPAGSTWCHRCWHGPYSVSSPVWNSRTCGVGASATRTSSYADNPAGRKKGDKTVERVSKNEALECLMKQGTYAETFRYSPTRQRAIQGARKSEGWTYTGEVIQSWSDAQGNRVQFQQGDYLERVSLLATGETLGYAAHRGSDNIWLLDSEEFIVEGQKYRSNYTFDPKGRIASQRVSYQATNACNHFIDSTADYTYLNEVLSSVRLKGGYDGNISEGSPQTRWEATVSYSFDERGRVAREDLIVNTFTKTYMVKPSGPYRKENDELYPSMKVKTPMDILRTGDLCAKSGISTLNNPIDLRPFYTISPNLAITIPNGVARVSVSFTYPEGFTLGMP